MAKLMRKINLFNMKLKHYLICLGAAFGAWAFGYWSNTQQKKELNDKYEQITSEFDSTGYENYGHGIDTVSVSPTMNKLPEGWRFAWDPEPETKTKVMYFKPQIHSVEGNLSDEEIRMLREKQSYKTDGSYIYTPGRIVHSREQEIQDYIDKHGDEIYEQLEDKYGN